VAEAASIPDSPAGFLVDDIDLDQLVGPEEMGFPEQQENGQFDLDGPNPLNNNIQAGLALTFMPEADPVRERIKIAEATRLWANHFATGSPSSSCISIPADWANLFTVLLLSAGNFP